MTDLKKLKKLADLCRKAGILHYKCADFEFTLSEAPPVLREKTGVRKPEPSLAPDKLDMKDTLTDEELLFWSSVPSETGPTQ